MTEAAKQKEEEMKTIACATDGSPSARNALTTAKGLAHTIGARLLVLNVQELGITRAGFLVDRNDHLLVALHRIVEQLRAEGIDALLATAEGPAGSADRLILELAQKAGADMLVIGNRGHGPLAGLFVGSVALRLIQSAPFPLLMVPSDGRAAKMQNEEHEGAVSAGVQAAAPDHQV